MRPFIPLALLFVIALVTTTSAQQGERGEEDEWPCSPPRSVIIVKWAEDASKAIQAAIDQAAATPGPDKVIIPHVGNPWIASETLNLCGELTLEFEPGVVLWAKQGKFDDKNHCLIKDEGVECVTLRGYVGTLRMRKHDYMMDTETYEPSEWRHCVKFNFGSEYVRILGLTMECAGGDGIYVGWDTRGAARPCRHVWIRDVTCRDNLRQGISITYADGVTIENCLLTRTAGNNPGGGWTLSPTAGITRSRPWRFASAGSSTMRAVACLSTWSACRWRIREAGLITSSP
ncbi:MAG TPA: hypothetical protein VM487_06975 [Phycisphaerae bacterium]|nr:hypothetical protein [Phycisphaerae bacterium]